VAHSLAYPHPEYLPMQRGAFTTASSPLDGFSSTLLLPPYSLRASLLQVL